MAVIILESVLFVALIATLGALFIWGVMQLLAGLRSHTPLGTHFRQMQNRRQIERTAARTCAIHGAHEEHEMVRLSNGERICPKCYQEILNGYAD